MRRPRVSALFFLGAGIVCLALALSARLRPTMVPLGIVFLILAVVQHKQAPRRP